jgi:hypothetical protein
MRWFGRKHKQQQQQPDGQMLPGDVAPTAARPGPRPGAKERVVRVFVSSTFRDMVEDRNELMTHVWPEGSCTEDPVIRERAGDV